MRTLVKIYAAVTVLAHWLQVLCCDMGGSYRAAQLAT